MPSHLRRLTRWLLFCVLVGQIVLAGWIATKAIEPPSSAIVNIVNDPLPEPEPTSDEILMDYPGVVLPEVVSRQDVQIEDDEVVIGVTVDDEHRAYLLMALVPISDHVVNDVLADKPISVAYCEHQDCLRVYSDDNSTEPLSLGTGGYLRTFQGGTMLLKHGKQRYRHDNQQLLKEPKSKLPYRTWPYERTTWGAWQRKHPDTTLYLGTSHDQVAQPTS